MHSPHVFKQSVISMYLGAEAKSASRDRLCRVRTYSRTPSADDSSGSREVSLEVADPFATLVVSPNNIGAYYLALCQTTAVVKKAGERVASFGGQVRGRLLRIAEIKGRSSADAGRTWEWDRTQHEGVHLENHTVLSNLIIPLDPRMSTNFKTFVFTHDELQGLTDALACAVDGLEGGAPFQGSGGIRSTR